MGRRRRAEVRQLEPDLVYSDTNVTAFINKLMRDGKKNSASRIFYGACSLVQERSGQEPLKVFRAALDNIKPRIEVRSRRVGGSTYQVPVEVIPRRSMSLSLRWLVAACDSRPERTAVERVADFGALAFRRAIPNIGAVGLIGAEPADRGHLEPRLDPWRVNL